MIILNIIKF